MHTIAFAARVAAGAVVLSVLAACGSSSGAASSPTTPAPAVSGVQTPSQISVVTAK